MNLLELIKSIKGLKCRDNTRQRATKPIDALELESALDTCRLAGKSCRTASQSRKQSAYWQLVKAYCEPFLKRFFVLSKAAAKMLWRNAIYGQIAEEGQGGGRYTYHCAKMLRLHLSIVNFVCRTLSYHVVSPNSPFFLPLSVSRGDPLDTLSSSPDCAAFFSGKCNFESVLNMPKSQTNAV